MVLSRITRFGNLGHVFKEGESDLLIGIARLGDRHSRCRIRPWIELNPGERQA